MNIDIINQTKQRLPRQYITSWLVHVEKQLIKKNIIKKKQINELNIIFMSRSKIKNLNNKYRDKNKPTDVLSFSGGFGLLGELVLCPEICQKQALENKHSFRDEVAYLVLHGLLHLLGYEHEGSKVKAQIMYKLQDDIFKSISSFN